MYRERAFVVAFTGTDCFYRCSFCYQRKYDEFFKRFDIRSKSDFQSLLKKTIEALKAFQKRKVKTLTLFEGGEISKVPFSWWKENLASLREIRSLTEKSPIFLTRNASFALKVLSDPDLDFIRIQISYDPRQRKKDLLALKSCRTVLSVSSFEEDYLSFEKEVWPQLSKEEEKRVSFRLPDPVSLSDGFEKSIKAAFSSKKVRRKIRNSYSQACSLIREVFSHQPERFCHNFTTVTKDGYISVCTRGFLGLTSETAKSLLKPSLEEALGAFSEKAPEYLSLEEKTAACLSCRLFLNQDCPGICFGRSETFCRVMKSLFREETSNLEKSV